MKPSIHGPVVHSDRPRQHSNLHRPLRYAFLEECHHIYRTQGAVRDVCGLLCGACVVIAAFAFGWHLVGGW